MYQLVIVDYSLNDRTCLFIHVMCARPKYLFMPVSLLYCLYLFTFLYHVVLHVIHIIEQLTI